MKSYMTQWNQIFNYWKGLNVPEVQIRDFIIGENTINSPWYNLKENRQQYFQETPLKETARHLSVTLKYKDQELIAAYKILAYMKYHQSQALFHPLKEVLDKFYVNPFHGWWHSQARIVLPHSVDYDYTIQRNSDEDWRNTIANAAKTWKDIAKDWAIIKIPDFMNYDSPEYEAFETFSHRKRKEKEYTEYLRLKEKFENNN